MIVVNHDFFLPFAFFLPTEAEALRFWPPAPFDCFLDFDFDFEFLGASRLLSSSRCLFFAASYWARSFFCCLSWKASSFSRSRAANVYFKSLFFKFYSTASACSSIVCLFYSWHLYSSLSFSSAFLRLPWLAPMYFCMSSVPVIVRFFVITKVDFSLTIAFSRASFSASSRSIWSN